MGRDREFDYFYNNRTLCDVLEDMRKLDKTRNYGAMSGLIEEAQAMGNRMEAGLSNTKDLNKLADNTSKARRLFKKEKKKYTKMRKKVEALEARQKKLKSKAKS